MKPMEMNCVEKDVAAKIKKHYGGKRHMIIGRTANITEALPGRSSCQYQNNCKVGCNYGAYFSTQSSTHQAAMKTGNLNSRPWSIVTRRLYDKDTKQETGVTGLDDSSEKRRVGKRGGN